MITFLLTFWKPIAIVLVVAALATAVGIEKHRYDERRRDEGRAEIQSKWDADIQVRIARTTAITNLWDGERQRADKEAEDHERIRVALFADVASLSDRLSDRDRAMVVPAGAVRVLNSAVVAANTDAAATPGKPVEEASATSGDSNVGELVKWGIDCAKKYADAVDEVLGLQSFYNKLREVPQ